MPTAAGHASALAGGAIVALLAFVAGPSALACATTSAVIERLGR